MNIVLGQENIQDLAGKYIVLSLDKFIIGGKGPIASYCVIENLPIDEMAEAARFRELHEKMIENYNSRNWNFCEHALEHLIGRWNRELDSFYHDISNRIQTFKKEAPNDDWQPTLVR